MTKQNLFSILTLSFFTLWNLADAAESKPHAPGMLGVALQEVLDEDVVTYSLPGEYGARVEAVAPSSPAATAGLEVNDVVVAFNGNRVESARMLRRMVQETPAGREVELRVIRQGRPILVSVSLGEGQETQTQVTRPTRSFGAWIVSVEPQLAEHLHLDEGVGLVVNEVQKNSAADRAGIQARDILLTLGGRPITSPEMVGETINAIPGNQIEVELIRKGNRETLLLSF
ncbi:MAG: PDZ domain-containing protein [Verrucomicrobia bacterium]|nr:PDZ domain-containing protein [Verrucomicrobiota bacterium]MCH8512766.1 PDZ domain-containing protein [Kiritimatiellia bacterium]